jgi:hypothetical protein
MFNYCTSGVYWRIRAASEIWFSKKLIWPMDFSKFEVWLITSLRTWRVFCWNEGEQETGDALCGMLELHISKVCALSVQDYFRYSIYLIKRKRSDNNQWVKVPWTHLIMCYDILTVVIWYWTATNKSTQCRTKCCSCNSAVAADCGPFRDHSHKWPWDRTLRSLQQKLGSYTPTHLRWGGL